MRSAEIGQKMSEFLPQHVSMEREKRSRHTSRIGNYIHVYIVFVFDSRLILGVVEKVCSISLYREIVRGENVES